MTSSLSCCNTLPFNWVCTLIRLSRCTPKTFFHGCWCWWGGRKEGRGVALHSECVCVRMVLTCKLMWSQDGSCLVELIHREPYNRLCCCLDPNPSVQHRFKNITDICKLLNERKGAQGFHWHNHYKHYHWLTLFYSQALKIRFSS